MEGYKTIEHAETQIIVLIVCVLLTKVIFNSSFEVKFVYTLIPWGVLSIHKATTDGKYRKMFKHCNFKDYHNMDSVN